MRQDIDPYGAMEPIKELFYSLPLTVSIAEELNKGKIQLTFLIHPNKPIENFQLALTFRMAYPKL